MPTATTIRTTSSLQSKAALFAVAITLTCIVGIASSLLGLDPLVPPPCRVPEEEVWVYRGLKGTNPSEFKNVAEDQGVMSVYEHLNPGVYKFVLPFKLRFTPPKASGTKGRIVTPPLIGALGPAVYTPEEAKPEIGQGHWNISWLLAGEVLKQWLSQMAKQYKQAAP